jgi:protein O-GlcNAc transferase
LATAIELCTLAFQNHQSGNLLQAAQLYQQALLADPENADANHLLGVLAYQTGQYEQAVASIKRALRASPHVATFYSNLGLSHDALGQVDEAVACFQQALVLQPHFAEAHSNLGMALQSQGKTDEAIAHFREALRIKPDYADALNNLGNALLQRDQVDEAIGCFHAALRSNANFAKAYNNLGNALKKKEKPDEALRCYQQAVTLDPNFAEAFDNLGILLGLHDQSDEAARCFEQAIRVKPGFAQAHYNLGCAHMEQGRADLAAPCFDAALRLQPDMASAQSNRLFCMNYDPQVDPATLFDEHCRWGQRQEMKVHAERQIYRNHHKQRFDRDPQRRLRIGYVSPDFRGHALARYLEPVLVNHDPQRVEVFCYAEVARPDDMTERMRKVVHGWRWTCGQTDARVAQQILDDKIDILVDLAGHTRYGRLLAFALKPAPIQATWLGYMNTTGLSAMDYRITDAVLDPPGLPVRDTEELLRLPGGMCCFAQVEDTPAVSPLPALRKEHLTFGSLNNLFKLNARVFDQWSELLKALPTARLLMFHHTLTAAASDYVRRQFAERGIAGDKLDLRRGSGGPGYLNVYEEIDVSLDSFPCTGGVTTCESLWMGVPVLTLCGARPMGRNSAAILTTVGLTDWITQTPDEYRALAVGLGNQIDELSRLRAGLRNQMLVTLCDGRRFTKVLEEAYRIMWGRWCAAPA